MVSQKRIRSVFVLTLVACVAYLLLPFARSLAMGGVFAILLFTPFKWLTEKKISRFFSALILTIGTTVLVVVPMFLLAFLGVNSTVKKIQTLSFLKDIHKPEDLLLIPGVGALLSKTVYLGASWFSLDAEQLIDLAKGLGQNVALFLAHTFGDLIAGIPSAALSILILMVTTLFLLADSKEILSFIKKHSFIDGAQTQQFLHEFGAVCRSVVSASLVSGIAQSLLFSLAYLFVNPRDVALVGFLVFAMTFIPVVGCAPITFGISAYLILTGQIGLGLFMGIMAIFAGVIDNLVRPLVLRGGANIPPLFALLSVFGGLQCFGFTGLFLGPILIGTMLIAIRLYDQTKI